MPLTELEDGVIQYAQNYLWSWPDHPQEMTDTDARMRVHRLAPVITENEVPDVKRAELIQEWGTNLRAGLTGCQRRAHEGDMLPRDLHGYPLDVHDQLAADLAEGRDGKPGTYTRAGSADPARTGPVDGDPTKWGVTGRDGDTIIMPVGPEGGGVAKQVDGSTGSRHTAENTASRGTREDPSSPETLSFLIAEGRHKRGMSEDLKKAAARIPEITLTTNRDGSVTFAVNTDDGKYQRRLRLEHYDVLPEDTAKLRLYGAARADIAKNYGSPKNKEEESLQVLAATLATQRGTCSAGFGNINVEGDALKTAGNVLMRQPERFADIVEMTRKTEIDLYPPWPGREMRHEKDMVHTREQHARENPKPDVFDNLRSRDEDLRARQRDQTDRNGNRPRGDAPRTGLEPSRPAQSPPRRDEPGIPVRGEGRPIGGGAERRPEHGRGGLAR